MVNRLPPFAYVAPQTLAEAAEILAGGGAGAFPLAGGTDLLVRAKRGGTPPRLLVNLKRIAELRGMEEEKSGLRIGALTTIAEMQRSPVIGARYPVLAETAARLGPPSIRTLATLGGNIGRASPASDMAPVLIVLSGMVQVQGPQSGRALEIENLFRGPGVTVLSPGEVITGFFLPEMPPGAAATYERLGRTGGAECALVGAAVFLRWAANGEEIQSARVALASVAPVPLRAKRAEEALLSGPMTEARCEEAARAAAADCLPISDIRSSAAYRREIARVLLLRALRRVLALARGGAA